MAITLYIITPDKMLTFHNQINNIMNLSWKHICAMYFQYISSQLFVHCKGSSHEEVHSLGMYIPYLYCHMYSYASKVGVLNTDNAKYVQWGACDIVFGKTAENYFLKKTNCILSRKSRSIYCCLHTFCSGLFCHLPG